MRDKRTDEPVSPSYLFHSEVGRSQQREAVKGGVDYGLDTCWYNPNAEPRPADLTITYEIQHLRELFEALE